MRKLSVKIFDQDMRRVITLIEQNQEAKARALFNHEIFQKYKEIQGWHTENPLSRIILFFYDLDEFLNNSASKIFGFLNRQDIIGSFYSDYQDDLKEALAQERKK